MDYRRSEIVSGSNRAVPIPSGSISMRAAETAQSRERFSAVCKKTWHVHAHSLAESQLFLERGQARKICILANCHDFGVKVTLIKRLSRSHA